MDMQYCIKHEREVFVYQTDNTHSVQVVDKKYPNIHDVTWCSGPFAFCPPPEELPFWSWKSESPSPDELAEMDAVASELMTEFV